MLNAPQLHISWELSHKCRHKSEHLRPPHTYRATQNPNDFSTKQINGLGMKEVHQTACPSLSSLFYPEHSVGHGTGAGYAQLRASPKPPLVIGWLVSAFLKASCFKIHISRSTSVIFSGISALWGNALPCPVPIGLPAGRRSPALLLRPPPAPFPYYVNKAADFNCS